MKHRIIDLLQCPCGNDNLELRDTVSRDVPFDGSFDQVRCHMTCAFRQRTITGDTSVTPDDCVACYSKEIDEGIIACNACQRIWPIAGGIPRFVPDSLAADLKKTQDTFSYEWKMFRFGERNWGQGIEYRKELLLDALGASPPALAGKLIFDAGCGSGLLSIEMANSFGMEVLALDLAYGIEQAFAHNNSPFVHFLQGSVLNPPFRHRTFDYLYCAGVLVATPNTYDGFKAIIRTLKRGGRCFIWVYHPISKRFYPRRHHKLAAYNWIRAHFTSRLPIRIQYYLYLSAMPVFLVIQSVELWLGRKSTQLTWREKMQNLFDSFSPKYQHRHEPTAVCKWYTEMGFENITVCNVGPEGFGVRGDRGKVAHELHLD